MGGYTTPTRGIRTARPIYLVSVVQWRYALNNGWVKKFSERSLYNLSRKNS